jgi:hypothetical protein
VNLRAQLVDMVNRSLTIPMLAAGWGTLSVLFLPRHRTITCAACIFVPLSGFALLAQSKVSNSVGTVQ